MSFALFIEQVFNSLQWGLMLFLMAAGVTLVFGVMNLVNLAQGSMFMLGGYFAVMFIKWTGNYYLGVLLALILLLIVACVVEILILRPLYGRGHLDQVLATFGLILFFNELVIVIWDRQPLYLSGPGFLSSAIELLPDVPYPSYRLAITAVAVVVGILLYILISRTRIGMLIRAGADQRDMVEALGVNIKILYTLVFGLGAALAGLAGIMTGPLLSVESGVGEPILILTLVVIIIGGIGSIKGALVGALLVGLCDTFGRLLLPQLLGGTAGNAIASMTVYILMAAILVWRPRGLVPASKG